MILDIFIYAILIYIYIYILYMYIVYTPFFCLLHFISSLLIPQLTLPRHHLTLFFFLFPRPIFLSFFLMPFILVCLSRSSPSLFVLFLLLSHIHRFWMSHSSHFLIILYILFLLLSIFLFFFSPSLITPFILFFCHSSPHFILLLCPSSPPLYSFHPLPIFLFCISAPHLIVLLFPLYYNQGITQAKSRSPNTISTRFGRFRQHHQRLGHSQISNILDIE